MFFSLTPFGIFTGIIEAAVISFVFFYIFGWVYNKFIILQSVLLTLRLTIAAIHVELRMIPESTRCTVDMLNQNFYFKSKDVGKTYGLLKS